MRAAIIGTGWGRAHVGTLRAAGVEVVALAGLERARTEEIARAEGVPRAVIDLAELEGLDVVVIATPPSTHLAIASRFPGARIVCEKPLSDVEPSEAEARLARALGARMRVNYAFGFLPAAAWLAERIADEGASHVALEVRVCLPLPARPIADARAHWLREVAVHPLAYLHRALGPLRPVHASRDEDALRLALEGACSIDVRVADAGAPGIDYALWAVTRAGSRLSMSGHYRVGAAWDFPDPTRDGAACALGPREAGDPWWIANRACVGEMIASWRGERAPDARLLDATDALSLERAVRGLSS